MSITSRPSASAVFDTPDGTATVTIDRDKGVLEIHADQEVTQLDWDVICSLLRSVGATDIGEPSYLGGVDVWKISLR